MANYRPIDISSSLCKPSNGTDEKLAPIILLHGITRTKGDWEGVDQRLADATRRNVYKLDARNHGDSDRSKEFDFDTLSEDVNYFMEVHSIPKAILIGHSMGGRTAMEVAGKYPEKVEKLIIEDMTPLGSELIHIKLLHDFIEFKSRSLDIIPPNVDFATAKNLIKEFLLERRMSIMKDAANERTREASKIELDFGESEDGFGYCWKTNLKVISNEEVLVGLFSKAFDKVYHGEVLFICGPLSPMKVINSKDRILEKFPKAVFEEIRDATHSVHSEYPEEFVQSCVEFIHSH